MWHYLPLFCLLHAKELLPIMPVSLWRTTANKGKKILKSLPVRYLHGN
ncbi:MAG: hypothetical protein [Bacteroides phage LoVEphage]|nr:MAG: hypothetical protein [Bacteroides phage LoVEphage]